MTVKHCLDCNALTTNVTRCSRCKAKHDRAMSAIGRRRRGAGWTKRSEAMRRFWAASFLPCAMAGDGKCQGAIQSDHVIAGSETAGFQPLCAYHNNAKGGR